MDGWRDEELVAISALEHWSYCPRQCALIHAEQTFEENRFTVRGHAVHERVDRPERERRAAIRVERALPLWSERLGLVGRADAVEFHDGTPYPVDYKLGGRRRREPDDLQLCAQALCLEEMFGCEVGAGAIFHHDWRRRREVAFAPALRRRVEEAVLAVRATLLAGAIPPPVNDTRCRHCSLAEPCLPGVVGRPARIRRLADRLFTTEDP